MKYNKLEIRARDPNNKKEISYIVDLVELNQPDNAISKVSAYKKIRKIKISASTFRQSNGEKKELKERVNNSIKY